jgi:DNA-binding response OmpR family regulator
MKRQKILIIEDEELIRDELGTLLSNAGYSVDYVTDFNHPLNCIKSISPDLILLDVNLPEQDGYSLCTSIRSFSQTPILFITGRNTSMDELQALTLGGDDFISKPYNIPILLARINSLLKRRQAIGQPNYLEYRGITLNPVAGTLKADGLEIELTKTELKIVYYLFEHPGEIVPRLDLVEYLWDNEIHIDDNTLSVNIMRIREKLRSLGRGELIQTKRGMGYKI